MSHKLILYYGWRACALHGAELFLEEAALGGGAFAFQRLLEAGGGALPVALLQPEAALRGGEQVVAPEGGMVFDLRECAQALLRTFPPAIATARFKAMTGEGFWS